MELHILSMHVKFVLSIAFQTAHRKTSLKGALYRIQILCRRYTFWSYPAGLTIADPAG